ncbi:TnpV protein [Acidaminobacter sp. JC074]|uniref:TnpV protein n=1 Tax=Acidaminobacter sp. JC074 TaxID=2530199 RepID=UPI002171A937|nr:TnpV protein [Acidaminobacter sp. JC074]
MMMKIETMAGIEYQVENGIYNPVIKTSTFEKEGGTYLLDGEILIPNLKVAMDQEPVVGIYARARKRYLEENKKAMYSIMIIKGTLQSHLLEVEQRAQRLLEMETPKMMKQLQVTEDLKKQDQMKWVGIMNNIKQTIEEEIYKEIVFN